ncbi:AMP-binding protein [Desulfococcaceae bacterium HSG7]|nr:AMP-binding protein [Desulfococcaceae bacterium HSG7]
MPINTPDAPFDKFTTLIEFVRHRAATQGDQIAYTFLRDGETEEIGLSYQELDLRARTIAAQLQQLGQPGRNALLVYPPGLDFIAAFFGCLYAGAVAVPAYPPEPVRMDRTLPRLCAIAQDADPLAILTTTNGLAMQDKLIAINPDFTRMQWLTTDQLTYAMASEWSDPIIKSTDLAYLQYTSGSTAAPKGVMITHANTLANLALGTALNGFTPDTTAVGWVPLYHDLGLIAYLLGPIYNGFHAVLMSPLHFLQRPVRWLQAISRYRATHNAAPPFGYDLCVRKTDSEQRATLDLSCWQVAGAGAEPVRPATLQRFAKTFAPCGFQDKAFYPTYGMAESVLYVAGGKTAPGPPVFAGNKPDEIHNPQNVKDPDQYDNVPMLTGCGFTRQGHQLLIVDPQSCAPCAPTQTGEIWASGPSIAQGYYNRKTESEYCFRAFTQDGKGPFMRTGDLGYIADQELFVTGRIKDLIIIRGRNHYPQDIELTAENSHPALRKGCCAAFSIEMGRAEHQTEHLIMVQEMRWNYPKETDLAALLQIIRQAIVKAHDIDPGALVLIKPGSIFKTSSGKIQRHACKSAFLEKELVVLKQWHQKTPSDSQSKPLRRSVNFQAEMVAQQRVNAEKLIQTWLVNQVTESLGIAKESLDPSADFDSYGLDSMTIVLLTGELEDWLGLPIPPEAVYDYPSIQKLACYLAALSVPVDS